MISQVTDKLNRSFQLFIATFAFVFVASLLVGLVSTTQAGAIDPLAPACQGAGADSEACGGGNENPLVGEEGVITRATNLLSIVVAIVAVIVIILAGLKYITSGDNPGELQQARNSIIYAGVALIVAGLAQAIVAFVLNNVK